MIQNEVKGTRFISLLEEMHVVHSKPYF